MEEVLKVALDDRGRSEDTITIINEYSWEGIQKKNHDWWMNYDSTDTEKYDSINNPNGNITTTRIMKDNSNWDIKDMQELNRHLIIVDSQVHSCSIQKSQKL